MPFVLAQRIRAICLLFLLPGMLIATWITRTPDVRDRLHASTDEMGLVLFGLALGAMAGVLSASLWVRRFGTRSVLAFNALLMVCGMAVTSIGIWLGNALVVSGGLALFGCGIGLAEVAVNIEGAAVERLSSRALMQRLHGCFSLGTVIGATLGIAFTAWQVPPALHLACLTALTLPGLWWAVRAIPPGNGRHVTHPEQEKPDLPARLAVWRDRRTLLLGIIVLAVALSEGAASDWLPLLLVDVHGLDATFGSLGFMLFACTMTLGRFSGNALLRICPRHILFRGSALMALAGVTLVIFSRSEALLLCAVVLWGMGTSVGFPLSMSAAGEGPQGDAQVAVTAIVGYVAFLTGPPGLGFIGEHFGLDRALLVVLVMLVVGLACSGAIRQTRLHYPGNKH